VSNESAFQSIVEQCLGALDSADPQASVETVLRKAATDVDLADAIARKTLFASLADMVIYRDENLTLLAGSLPPGFSAAPHNHNLWSVVSVLCGREDNRFYERDGDGLKPTGEASVEAPGVLPNPADVIHSICNPLDEPLLVLHAYGGDLLAVSRSNWDPETHKEIPFDWQKVRSQA